MKRIKSQSSQQTSLKCFFKTQSTKNVSDAVCSQSSVDSGIISDPSPEKLLSTLPCDNDNKKEKQHFKESSFSQKTCNNSAKNKSSPKKKEVKLKLSPKKLKSKNPSNSKVTNVLKNILNRSPSKNSCNLNALKSLDIIDLCDDSSNVDKNTLPLLRRSPRKHPNSSPPKQVKKADVNIRNFVEKVVTPSLDETDDAYFVNLKSPIADRTKSPKGIIKRKRSLSFSPKKPQVDNLKKNCLDVERSFNYEQICLLPEPIICGQEVDLSKGCRCRVVSVNPLNNCDLDITVTCLETKSSAVCTLQYPWNSLTVSVGDYVSIKAIKESSGNWSVSDKNGTWLVLDSDTLLSCTNVVGSLFCKRRSVLSQLFKESPSGSQASAMHVGIVVHLLMQQALKRKIHAEEDLQKLFEEVIGSQEMVKTAFLQSLDLTAVQESVSLYLPKIIHFIKEYLDNPGISNPAGDSGSKEWPGKITQINDIEENVWIPQMGLKGKIDATIQVKVHSNTKVMPLELKTGKVSNSVEHRGQVMLYCMMLSQLTGHQVDSGLLLYLKENVVKEIKGGEIERRDLLMLRNELALRLQQANSSSQLNGLPSLPDPIDWKSVCSSCPQLIPCTTALRLSGETNHGLCSMIPERTSHLSDKHLEYIFHWLRLISLEVSETRKNNPIWAKSIQSREEHGSCISGLRICGDVIVKKFKIEMTFTRDIPIAEGVLDEGEYVTVSIDKQVAIACGHVQSVNPSVISLLIDRDLRKFDGPFHIDRYESGSSTKFLSSFLSVLLEDLPRAADLRRFIIDLELPKFATTLKKKIKKICFDVFSNINKMQVRALLQVLSAESFIIIKGMPGTGKSKTVTALIEVLTLLSHSVLLTSHTHSAVDNILLRLPSRLHDKVMRLGSTKRVHPQLAHLTETSLLSTLPSQPSLVQLSTLYNSKSIVGVTCYGSGHQLLSKREFDYCIIDEATQVCQPEAFFALFACKKFVLIGDPQQLPPLVISEKSKDLGMGVSLLERLDRPAVTTYLVEQYRMNQEITTLANLFTYNNLLKCANQDVASSTIVTSKKLAVNSPEWVSRVCSSDISNSILVIDVIESNQLDQNINETEANVVLSSVNALKQVGVTEEDIGIISPYRAQVTYLEKMLRKCNCPVVEVSTVDQYQGRDKSVIVYSASRNKPMVEGVKDILSNKNRLTVAITRAKHKLILIGNVTVLNSFPTFNHLLSQIDKNNFLTHQSSSYSSPKS